MAPLAALLALLPVAGCRNGAPPAASAPSAPSGASAPLVPSTPSSSPVVITAEGETMFTGRDATAYLAAEDLCSGKSVDQVAGALGVANERPAVLEAVGKRFGSTARERKIAANACDNVLTRT